MTWDRLFDELELQLDDEARREEATARVEEERLRLGRLTIRDRLAGIAQGESPSAVGAVRVELRNGLTLTVQHLTFGRDWFAGRLVGSFHGERQCVVPFEAITAILATRDDLVPSLRDAPQSPIKDRIGLPFALRDLCRRRLALRIIVDNGEFHGTIDRVGRDHVDLAVHDRGTLRRERAVVHYRVIPLARLLVVFAE